MAARLDPDLPPPQLLVRVLVQLLVIRAQDVRCDVVDADGQLVAHLWVEISEFVLRQVVQLSRHLDPRRPAAHDRHMQQLLHPLGRRVGQTRLLQQVEEHFAHLHRVAHILHEQRVLRDAWRAERVRHAPGRDDEDVVLELEPRQRLVRVVVECRRACTSFPAKVDPRDVGFDEAEGGAGFGPHGVFGEVEVEEAAGGGGEERGVGRRAAGRDDGHGVFGRGDALGDVEAGPAGANDEEAREGRAWWRDSVGLNWVRHGRLTDDGGCCFGES